MNWFVTDRRADDLQPLAGRIPDWGRQVSLAAQQYWQRFDTWSRSNQIRSEMMGEMEKTLGLTQLGGNYRGLTYSDRDGTSISVERGDAQVQFLTDRIAAARAAGAPFGVLPASPTEFQAEATRRHTREFDDITGELGRGDSTSAKVIGAITGAVLDPINLVASLAGGAPKAGQLAWFIGREAAINAAAEVPAALRARAVAPELGQPVPTAAETAGDIAFAGGLGAGLASLIAGGAKALGYLRERNAAEDAIRPPYVPPAQFDTQTTAAKRALELGIDPTVPKLAPDPKLAPEADPAVTNLLSFVGNAEAPQGYDQVYSGIGSADLPPKPLSTMTVDEVLAWQDGIDPRYPSEAAGRYQIMEDTLRGLKDRMGLTGAEVFDQAMQDRLAIELMRGRGLDDWRAGRLSSADFADNLAGEWASLPDRTGKSRYAGDGLNAARVTGDDLMAVLGGERAASAPRYATSRGYTGAGQVRVGDWGRVDVKYEVVDASVLQSASGRFQPRDRGQVNSDAWIADTAADLDPLQLGPSPNAATGAPLVGPDNMIESGNGRFAAIQRAYELHPDRAEEYRRMIGEVTGRPIPEGMERPVLIARRTSKITDDARESLTVAAQDSGVAMLTQAEAARVGARHVTPERLATLDLSNPLRHVANAEFVRRFAEAMPKSVRNAMFAGNELTSYGEDLVASSVFARAWPDRDIVDLLVARRGSRGLRSLLDALDDAAPAWAAMRADIDAGLIRPEFDITAHVLEAMRTIATARNSANGGRGMETILSELLRQSDGFGGEISPLSEALVRKFWPGRQASQDEVAAFLRAYASEARTAGAAEGSLLAGATPAEVLRQLDPEVFGKLPDDLGKVRDLSFRGQVDGAPQIHLAAVDGSPFADGTAAPAVEQADAAIEADIRAAIEPKPEGQIAAGATPTFADALIKTEDGTFTVREVLDGLEKDAALKDVLEACKLTWGRQ